MLALYMKSSVCCKFVIGINICKINKQLYKAEPLILTRITEMEA